MKQDVANDATALSSGQTVYEPSATDPRIVAVLEAELRLERAGNPLDLAAFEALFAPDLVVHAPINKVVQRDNILARMRSGQIAYEPDFDRTIDFAGVRGNLVVIMGEEVVRPTGAAPNAGKLIRRRFTDIWKLADGAWTLAIRQATVISAE
jgi:hypothetical protein